ncbi:hypothetical protein [Alkalibacterium gilvum]|uniref:Uncharacterized protein n=2 Tax=Alkalibacterium gilvum TaxID=1130080 RepID=A0A1H6S950_9LACT|nr:hypothetical protein [Alkalibacterium gilvum]SEI63326.1 hypothetical protein SAMN04488113_10658 [Alkalibacterium gilvum]
MPYEDQDFIMRQIKNYAKGIGVLLDISSLKELLKLEFSIEESLSDSEIESIIYTARIENYINRRVLSEEELEKLLGLNREQIDKLVTTTEKASQKEVDLLKELVENEKNWINT